MDIFDFRGKKALVTGASSGVGRETAIQLSRTGAKVVLIARREDELRRTLSMMEGDGHTYKIADISDFDTVVATIKQIVAQDGLKIDYVAHCAGIVNPTPLRAVTAPNIDYIFRTNFYSFAAILKCAGIKMLFNNGGSIVGISSTAALFGEVANGIYAASKGAMDALAKCAAQELRNRKIRVNNICSIFIKTEMTKGLKYIEQDSQVLMNKIALDPEHVASLIISLFSESMQYVSGVSILVDGALEKSFEDRYR